MDYFVLLGDSASTIFVSLHNRRFMSQATGGERGILREARDGLRRILAIPTLVSRFAQNAAFDCTLVFC